MKFKTFMPVLALACICAVGQADAAQDRLMMPEQPAEPLNVLETEVALSVPSEEVRDVLTLSHNSNWTKRENVSWMIPVL